MLSAQGKKLNFRVKGLVGHGRKMEQQVVAKLSPANLAQNLSIDPDSICLFAFRRLSGVPHLPGRDVAVAEVGRQSGRIGL